VTAAAVEADPFDALLLMAAQEANEGSRTMTEAKSRLRWEVAGDGKKITIMRTGSKVKGVSNRVLSISPNGKHKDLYPSWKQALDARAALQSATGSKRVSHKQISMGAIPEQEQG